jgi:hypothetical protein
MDGSFTWLDRSDGSSQLKPGKWIACFVHYGNKGAEPNRDSAWTQIIAFDDEWRRTGGWALPPDLIERFGGRGYSASGGAFGPGGYLYLTGHDNTELYVVAFPQAGSVMKWIATIPIPAEGPGLLLGSAEGGRALFRLEENEGSDRWSGDDFPGVRSKPS